MLNIYYLLNEKILHNVGFDIGFDYLVGVVVGTCGIVTFTSIVFAESCEFDVFHNLPVANKNQSIATIAITIIINNVFVQPPSEYIILSLIVLKIIK